MLVGLVSGLALVLLMIRLRLQRKANEQAAPDDTHSGVATASAPLTAPEAVDDTDFLSEWHDTAGRKD